MAYIDEVSIDEATGLLRRIYRGGIERAGEVANIIRVMSLDPPTAQTSMMFYVALMKADHELDRSRREMLAAVVSNVNECYY